MKNTIAGNKFLLLGATILYCSLRGNAQPTANPGMKELSEKVIPWENILMPYGNAAGRSTTVQGRTYTAYQIALIDSFTQWIRKSYIPVGGLPQPERLALPDSRDNTEYLPRGTGVAMAMWAPCYDASGKKIIKAQPASANRIIILTNHLKGLEPAHDYNSPTQYFFTMYYDKNGKLVNEEDEKTAAPYVNEIRSRIGNYFVYFTGQLVNVLLMPEKELPVQQLSIGEVLDKAEEAIQRVYPDPNHFLHKEVKSNIAKYRNKYRSALQQPATVHMAQLTATSFTGEYDPFQSQVNTKYMFPVYQFKPAVYESAKQNKPLWVHISFPYATEKSSTVNWEIFKAMTTNFNYQYVYDYFFNPDKVKNLSYQPLRPVSQAGAEATIRNRDNTANTSKTFPEGIHFMEDFADARSGTLPAGWSSKQKNRSFEIVSLPGETGKWLYLDSGADLVPSGLKTPLPLNFTLEFDLVCTNYTHRAGRMVAVSLSGPNSTLYLQIIPGNEQNIRIYPSMANFRVNAGTAKQGYHFIEFTSYSNLKTKAHVKLVKSGTTVDAYINGTKVESEARYQQDYAREMAVGAADRFTKLEWTSDQVSQNPPVGKGKVYISNIRIRKD